MVLRLDMADMEDTADTENTARAGLSIMREKKVKQLNKRGDRT